MFGVFNCNENPHERTKDLKTFSLKIGDWLDLVKFLPWFIMHPKTSNVGKVGIGGGGDLLYSSLKDRESWYKH